LSGDIINNAETPVPVPHNAATDNVVSPAVSEDLRSDEETAREAFGAVQGEIAKAFSWDSEPAELASVLLSAESLPFTLWHNSLTLAQLFWFPPGPSPLQQASRDTPTGGVFSGHARRLTLSAAPELTRKKLEREGAVPVSSGKKGCPLAIRGYPLSGPAFADRLPATPSQWDLLMRIHDLGCLPELNHLILGSRVSSLF
jgi:hypothetical protein